MEAWKEYLERNPDIKYHLDIDSDIERTNIETFLNKQNELIQVMNDVARKFIQWSIPASRRASCPNSIPVISKLALVSDIYSSLFLKLRDFYCLAL